MDERSPFLGSIVRHRKQLINNTFLVTGLGRSGTSFLARLMNRTRACNVFHEWHLPVPGYEDLRLRKFPIHRFYLGRHPLAAYRKGYGEVNSYLRFYLDPMACGAEQLIPKKAIIHRDPREVITSVMNRGGRTIADFDEVCDRILRMYWNLRGLLKLQSESYRRVEFNQMVTDANYLYELLDWVGITDVDISPQDLATKVNQNDTSWFPEFKQWELQHISRFETLYKSYGSGKPPKMPIIK